MAVAAMRLTIVAAVLALLAGPAGAQDKPAKFAKPANGGLNGPAKQLFGARAVPADMAARAIGFYSRGCLAGAVALPVDGKTWQVMRLSRNRNWGHPDLIRTLE